METFKKFMIGFGSMLLVFIGAGLFIGGSVMLAKYLAIFIPIPGQLIFIGLILLIVSFVIGIVYALES